MASGPHTQVGALYDQMATAFDRDRTRSGMERPYLERILAALPGRGCRILDLGCGAGEPMARAFIDAGHEVTGIDLAPAMIALCRERFPYHEWLAADMRWLMMGWRFHAILAWDSLFHLTVDDQREMFPKFRDQVEPGGWLLFTSGSEEGVAIGEMYGHPLFHASLNLEEYARLLIDNGFHVVIGGVSDPDCGDHTIWLARAR